MTDNEIIKALECCSKSDSDCENCPANGLCDNDDYCLTGAILDLINRQKAEIEKKDTEIDILIRKKEALRDEISELTAEVERLSDGNHKCIYLSDDETTEYCVDGACSVYKNEAMIKSEAYREFWLRLKTDYGRKMHGSDFGGEFWGKAILVEDGDNLVKELTESKNDFKE